MVWVISEDATPTARRSGGRHEEEQERDGRGRLDERRKCEGRHRDDASPAVLLDRYGRHTLEEVFLDVARGRAHLQEAAQ